MSPLKNEEVLKDPLLKITCEVRDHTIELYLRFLGIQGIACMVTLLKEDQSATMFNRFSDREQAVIVSKASKSLNKGLKETKRQT